MFNPRISSSLSRRHYLKTCVAGISVLGMGNLAEPVSSLEHSLFAGTTHHNPLASKAPHHPARAKRVIFLFMHGGPSQVDTFDYKPRLQKEDGKDLPFKVNPHLDAKTLKILGSPWKFSQHGECGHWVSELFPQVASHADDLCLIHSMHTKGVSHGQAVSMLHTGSDSMVRPSLGAWVAFGLGTENLDLPPFVAITPSRGHGGPRNYGSAFLPAIYQATAIGHSGIKVKDASIDWLSPGKTTRAEQQKQLALLQGLNQRHWEHSGRDAQLAGVMDSYNLAFRMQSAAPEVMDISEESSHTLKMYGIGENATDDFGRECLLARRFSEAGVRFVQVSYKQNAWDQHGNLLNGHTANARAVDLPIAGLLTDLKQRGLLEETLIVWAGEFGRTPIVQGKNGRDHNPGAFTVWMAGGGVKAGFRYGSTDEYGCYAIDNKVHMHDLHATILHLLGMNHERLTYRYAGRDFRLTDIAGHVVKDVLG